MKISILRRKYQQFTVVEFLDTFDIYTKGKDKLKKDIYKIKEDITLSNFILLINKLKKIIILN